MNGTYPAGMGEPLNVILSGDSDAEVLVKSVDDGGFLNYMLYVQLFRYIKASYPRRDLRLTLWQLGGSRRRMLGSTFRC